MNWPNFLLAAAGYLSIAAVTFGVLLATIEQRTEIKLSTIVVSALVWPLALIAAIAYTITDWLDRK
jgi:hypothetical protein